MWDDNVSKAECATCRADTKDHLLNQLTPLLEKLASKIDEIHKSMAKMDKGLAVNNQKTDTNAITLKEHMDKEEKIQDCMNNKLDDIKKMIKDDEEMLNNKIDEKTRDKLNRSEFYKILWALCTVAMVLIWIVIGQIDWVSTKLDNFILQQK